MEPWQHVAAGVQCSAPDVEAVLGVAEADGVSAPDHWSCPRLAVLLLKRSVAQCSGPAHDLSPLPHILQLTGASPGKNIIYVTVAAP